MPPEEEKAKGEKVPLSTWECLCMSVLQKGNSKKGSGKCGCGGFVVLIGNLVTLLTGCE